jgi:hypothetical protein
VPTALPALGTPEPPPRVLLLCWHSLSVPIGTRAKGRVGCSERPREGFLGHALCRKRQWEAVNGRGKAVVRLEGRGNERQ